MFDDFPDTGKARVIVAPENADKMETLVSSSFTATWQGLRKHLSDDRERCNVLWLSNILVFFATLKLTLSRHPT